MIPQLLPITHLIQLTDAHPVFICGDMLRHDIHGHLTEIHIRADTCRGRNTRGLQHITDHRHGQLMGRHLVIVKVVGDIHEHLVDTIHMDILGSYIFKVCLIDTTAHFHVMPHTRWSHHIV